MKKGDISSKSWTANYIGGRGVRKNEHGLRNVLVDIKSQS